MRVLRGPLVLLAAAALLAGFVWGFLVQRSKIFPHRILRRAAISMGASLWQAEPLELTKTPPIFGTTLSIPYIDAQRDPSGGRGGVLTLEDGADAGYNFFSVPGQKAAYLVDMRGKLLWRWTLAQYPEYTQIGKNLDVGFTHLFENGDVLAYIGKRAVMRLDKSSRILWRFDGYVHHDAWANPDGTVLALIKREKFDARVHPGSVILADRIAMLSRDGRPVGEIALLDALEESPFAFLVPQPPGDRAGDFRGLDVLHANHVEVYDGSLDKMSPLFRKGNILVSLRDNNSIMILDAMSHRPVWVWGPMNVTLQHHATILENGDVLLFDNGLKHSRVVEVDPRTNAIVWTYSGPEASFFSPTRGSCQRLSNGNTLICVSQTGYAVEVTPGGRVVWKYLNPRITKDDVREVIFQMRRYRPRDLRFLGEASP